MTNRAVTRNKQTEKKTWLNKCNAVYLYEMWVRKPEKKDRKPNTRDSDGDVDMRSVQDKISSIGGIIA